MNKERKKKRVTSSGIEVKDIYTEKDLSDFDPAKSLGQPGEYPFTRGTYSDMYRGKLWTMRQYAGFATAEESNKRYRFLLSQGQTGLSVAFDLPTQIGLDSDHAQAQGEVGKVGVAIDSLKDMEVLFSDIPLDKVSVSMTINSTAAIILSMYLVLAETRGIAWDKLKGTIQNDILKEYIARGTYIYPPQPSLKIITDTLSFCRTNVPQWNTMSISGYHIREAGATAVQELAFTFANAIEYIKAAMKVGLNIDAFAPRLSDLCRFPGANDHRRSPEKDLQWHHRPHPAVEFHLFGIQRSLLGLRRKGEEIQSPGDRQDQPAFRAREAGIRH